MLLLPSICHVISKGNWYVCIQEFRDLMEGGCDKIALPLDPEPALRSDLQIFECTGLKVTHLREYLTE